MTLSLPSFTSIKVQQHNFLINQPSVHICHIEAVSNTYRDDVSDRYSIPDVRPTVGYSVPDKIPTNCFQLCELV